MAFQEKSLQVIVQLEEFAMEAEAKAACAWILGEFGEYIRDAGERIKQLVDGFASEETKVQLQILTACVKLFLKFPNDNEQLITQLLTQSTESFNPDVRDRGYIYWRLLSTDPERTKKLVCSDSTAGPVVESSRWEKEEVLVLLENLGSVSNIFHKVPQRKLKQANPPQDKCIDQALQQAEKDEQEEKKAGPAVQPPQGIDLLDLDDAPVQQPQPQTQAKYESFDLI